MRAPIGAGAADVTNPVSDPEGGGGQAGAYLAGPELAFASARSSGGVTRLLEWS